ncbi:MAG: BlaI/MecI/CopY family transcriptional regulator [Actinomycetota bacterium]
MDNKDSRKKSEEIGINGLNSISNLEANIMKIIWDRGKATVREVHETMLRQEIEKKQHGFIPYTTVMSTMNTLAEKGLLKQDRSAKTYTYSPAVTKTDLARSIIKSVAEKILEGTPQFKKVDRFINGLS